MLGSETAVTGFMTTSALPLPAALPGAADENPVMLLEKRYSVLQARLAEATQRRAHHLDKADTEAIIMTEVTAQMQAFEIALERLMTSGAPIDG